ncbi:DNA utilization protein GntX [Mixta tenebrionis]|uniref:DNA utilization protein GntX n=1 Tax=Mixta tenebrionis TaxID=2562439 RepID=A0A506V8S6_9GAMM|nr:DNA utilization protein GntX [Mixta tenebrionis]TPW42078.1 DNA utilization protein GntX [Mixta tenebrionis]
MLPMQAGCWLCQTPLKLPRQGLCSYCLRALPPLPPCCPRCGLAAANPLLACRRCLRRPPPWQHLVAVSAYGAPLSQLIARHKFSRVTALSVMLARLILLSWLAARRQRGLQRPDLLLTVPLHHRRAWRRGFNQADLLARPLARWLGCAWRPDGLTRRAAGHIQHQLSASARKRNLRNAFRLEITVRDRHIALIDDVVTTGSTVAEISRLLMQAGAASVQIWCLCRTL